MEDIYAAMMGEPISDVEKQKALARKMALQRQFGQTGQILGGRMLKEPAQQMISAADESAGKLAGFNARQREINAQERMAITNDEAQARAAELQRQHALEIQRRDQAFDATQRAQDRALSRSLAAEKANAKGKYSIPAALGDKLSNEASEVQGIASVTSGFKPSFAGAGIPGVRGLKNYAASKGIGTEADKEAQKWWSDWDKAYTLPTRNKMFGSALTAPERKAWNEANITKDMTPDQIMKNLATIEGLRSKALERKRQYYISKGADPDELDILFGIESTGGDTGGALTQEGAVMPSSRTKYHVGQIINAGGKQYRVTGGDLNNDPDVEEL